ncbi:probable E3 ubiquitin-protein ligase DTX3 [Watersipora subatra]|uniref:probable E3 ubiquitin-protein ligase DTX3 n=1 Tax=Watersipora subatra TaxID=2589382 RepID=UPI00355BA10A
MAYNYAKNAFTNFIPGMPADLGLSPEHGDHWPKLEAASPPYSADTQGRTAATGYSAAAATGNRVSSGIRGVHGGATYKDKPGVHEDPPFKPTAGTNPAASATGTSKPNENECPICLDELKDVEALPCSHKFCKNCISQLVTTTKSNQCPTCRYPFRNAEGKQPKGGKMTSYTMSSCLPGYERHKTIVIVYDIPGGIQGPEHPQPGAPYQGARRRAYLPDSTKGKQAERLLKKAFDQRLVFTVGHSITTGRDGCVTWNDIHHKTNMTGGPSNYGYPDPDYLDRLIEDLSARGICE